MNTTEIRKAALSAAIDKTNFNEIAIQIGDASFVIPVEVEDEGPRYVEFKATVKNNKDTKTVKAFDIDEAINEYKATLVARAEEARIRAEEKASKGKKSSRKIED